MKALKYPQRGYYDGITRQVGEVFVFTSANREYTRTFKKINKTFLEKRMERYRRLVDKYLTHKRDFPQLYAVKYKDGNISEKALLKGFVPQAISTPFSLQTAQSNFYGCSKQNPDIILCRGDKTIHISLQGIFSAKYWHLMPPELNAVAAECATKMILLKQKEEIIYIDFSGKLPPSDVLHKFLCK